jgi:UDP-N-acetylglucosamine 2-epimerase (hydrolysing)
MQKKILFMTGTRADFGKLRSLLDVLDNDSHFSVQVFITGMHMLSKYGSTYLEVEARGYKHIHKYINQNYSDTMDTMLAKTIAGLSDFVKENRPDMIVVHGDRVEAIAGALVGSLNNILVAHIEGGEVSGTVDDLIRHAVSKLSHLHFVSNERAKKRLLQLGESASAVYVIGSPDVDALFSNELPTLQQVKERYEIPFARYGIVLFHPVTTEADDMARQARALVEALQESQQQYVVIYPNNDHGNLPIIAEYNKLASSQPNFRVFPSMRFDYFLTLLKHATCMVGNSSSALMEAPYYGVPAVNIGTRQNNRAQLASVVNCASDKQTIAAAIQQAQQLKIAPQQHFGDGKSCERFIAILQGDAVWQTSNQKCFVDTV